ncbi:hypothetical protein BB561_002988 [Smittium simulii]|uniref:GATA-type domain-containing protein n=1 Tax=Smittium simulii TaxID=133385 RepID=A0A2T9YNG2_9FUNG|nr:hypothetical protein BB561_002988 [Smittium simulii]
MAPIILKIKGAKLFSPFSDIDYDNDLSVIWKVCTKVKDSLENGSRLENLSWRLWHLQQNLVGQGRGNALKKLLPVAQKKFDSAENKFNLKNRNSLKIKVKIPKKTSTEPLLRVKPNSPDSLPRLPKIKPSTKTSPPKENQLQNPVSPENNRITSTELDSKIQPSILDNPNPLQKSFHLPDIKQQSSQPFNSGKNQLEQLIVRPQYAMQTPNNSFSLKNQPFSSYNYIDPSIAFNNNNQILGLKQNLHYQNIPPKSDILGINTNKLIFSSNSQHIANSSPKKLKADSLQASELMSFGPSSFLSSGVALDLPQIEITLDDIFPQDSAGDFGQYGFSQYTQYKSNFPDDLTSSVTNMWGGGNPALLANIVPDTYHPEDGFFDNKFASRYNINSMNNSILTQADKFAPRINFQKKNLPDFNSNHISPHIHGSNTPIEDNSSFESKTQKENDVDLSTLPPLAGRNDGPECYNCNTRSTPLWRKCGPDILLCNACGLYYRLHNKHRPKILNVSGKGKENSKADSLDQMPECLNCKTSKTPLWRKDEDGNPLCNACGLYYKLHKTKRPITLKSDVIRKRQRAENVYTDFIQPKNTLGNYPNVDESTNSRPYSSAITLPLKNSQSLNPNSFINNNLSITDSSPTTNYNNSNNTAVFANAPSYNTTPNGNLENSREKSGVTVENSKRRRSSMNGSNICKSNTKNESTFVNPPKSANLIDHSNSSHYLSENAEALTKKNLKINNILNMQHNLLGSNQLQSNTCSADINQDPNFNEKKNGKYREIFSLQKMSLPPIADISPKSYKLITSNNNYQYSDPSKKL